MKTFAKIRPEVSHGGTAPRGWWFAWYEPRGPQCVLLPAAIELADASPAASYKHAVRAVAWPKAHSITGFRK
jgi:hypothetical protein